MSDSVIDRLREQVRELTERVERLEYAERQATAADEAVRIVARALGTTTVTAQDTTK